MVQHIQASITLYKNPQWKWMLHQLQLSDTLKLGQNRHQRQVTAWLIMFTRPRLLPFTSFSIHYSLIILTWENI
jgi:hypothetical protein